MIAILWIVGIGAVAFGALVLGTAQSAIHEIEAGISLAFGFVAMGLGTILAVMERGIGHLAAIERDTKATLELMRAVRERRPEKPEDEIQPADFRVR